MKFRKPMLAKDYEGNAHKITFPCFVQPKLDGIRCVTDGRTFWSRNGKKFLTKNLKHLACPKVTSLIDGELMVLGAEHFEDIVSAVKNGSTLDRSLAKRIRFNVFDMMVDAPFNERRLMVKMNVTFAQEHGAKWLRVETHKVKSQSQLEQLAKDFLRRGFEGTMVRTFDGPYVNKRTRDLIKWKPLRSAEFKIVGVKEARGKDKGTPVFICMSKGGQFRARPMGSMAQRKKMWRDRDTLIGRKDLTVEFQNYTKHGKPRFPRAKVLRDYE